MTCPTCRDTGIASTSPFILGTAASHTMSACACDAGKALTKRALDRAQDRIRGKDVTDGGS